MAYRLFYAIDFPDRIRKQLVKHRDVLQEASLKGNFTRWENMHLTLLFIGETDDVSPYRKTLESLDFHPFSLRFNHIGKFQKPGGDIFWLGLDEKNSNLAALEDLYRQVVKALPHADQTQIPSSYTPHITLGRQVRLKDESVLASINQDLAIQPVEVAADRAALMLSHRVNGVLTYTPLHVIFGKNG